MAAADATADATADAIAHIADAADANDADEDTDADDANADADTADADADADADANADAGADLSILAKKRLLRAIQLQIYLHTIDLQSCSPNLVSTHTAVPHTAAYVGQRYTYSKNPV